MLLDRVSNPGPLSYESGALPIALRGPATLKADEYMCTTLIWNYTVTKYTVLYSFSQVLYKCNIEVLDLNRSSKPRSRFENLQNTVKALVPHFVLEIAKRFPEWNDENFLRRLPDTALKVTS